MGWKALTEWGDGATRQAHADLLPGDWQRKQHEATRSTAVEWLERFEREHDNLRATLEWSLEPSQVESLHEMALSACRGADGVLEGARLYSEARTFLERVLACSEGVAAAVRARTLDVAASFAR